MELGRKLEKMLRADLQIGNAKIEDGGERRS
jgi:hypothetical protein